MARPSGRKTSQFKLGNVQPAPSVPSLQNSFVGGLKTEFTGLNFPENSCTNTSNCVFTRVGNVTRRNGIDFETNAAFPGLGSRNAAISTFLWENAGGDGLTTIEVCQVGGTVNFFGVVGSGFSASTPLSASQYGFVLNLSSFQVTTLDTTQECQYTSGNGYLFIFHPNCDPIYVTNNAGTLSANSIPLQIRDFIGVNDTYAVNFRPPTLTTDHQYNLQNQGWTSGSPWTGQWSALSITQTIPLSGSTTFTLTSNSSATLTNGDIINFSGPSDVGYLQGGATQFDGVFVGSGTVTAYTAGVSITLNVTSFSSGSGNSGTYQLVNHSSAGNMFINFTKVNTGFLNTWFTAEANYPSNADIWYLYKDNTGAFNPGTTQPSVATLQAQAPQGHYILPAFNQNRTAASGLSVTNVSTLKRPTTGAFYQGRVFYAGVNDTQVTTGDAFAYTWTENIYFSQIIQNTTDFGLCFQSNDPTSQTLNALLPTDGGVIHIQNSGSIYKLFPVQNGLLVFAANGIWFVTGNTGIGFTANDYSVTKISGEHAISGKSFISIQGYPIFWNADGIYMVSPGQAFQAGQRGLEVQNLTLPTIKSFYQAIPLSSKKNARGAYNHITGEVRWLFKSTEAVSTLDAYNFDSVLNYLTYTQAFYPWTLPNSPNVISIDYIEGPGGANVPAPQFYYFTSTGSTYSFSQEKDNVNWVDFHSTTPVSYISSFTTGYQLKGQGQRKFQPMYVYLYSEIPVFGYEIQGSWDYAASPLSNKISSRTVVNNNLSYFSKKIKKHRLRGSGYVLQYKITSNDGKPFNFAGWAVSDIIGTM